MEDLAVRLATIEGRLNRSLADGWRHSAADRQVLTIEADELDRAGLSEFAARLRVVTEAPSARAALETTTIALAASRLLRARLGSTSHESRTTQWVVPRKGRAADREQFWPLGRFSLNGTTVWSCLRARNYPVEWMLIEETPELARTRFFGTVLTGHVRWRGRFPVGSKREVQIGRLEDAATFEGAADDDLFQALRRRLVTGKLKEDKLPAWGGGAVRLVRLDQDQVDGCFWLDEAVKQSMLSLLSEQCWVLVWEPGEVRVVVGAVLEKGLLLKKLSVVSLTPGCESVEMGKLG